MTDLTVAAWQPSTKTWLDVLISEQDLSLWEAARYGWKVRPDKYLQGTVAGRQLLFHRYVLGQMPGTGLRVIVDHINRNRLDNRRSNLRVVTAAQSGQNRAGRSPYGRGVQVNRGRYGAKVTVNGRWHWLGTYDTPQEAAAVAAEGRRRLMTHAGGS